MKKKFWIIILALSIIIIIADQINQAVLRKQDEAFMAFKKRNIEMYQGDKPLRDWGYKSRKYKKLNPYPGHWGT